MAISSASCPNSPKSICYSPDLVARRYCANRHSCANLYSRIRRAVDGMPCAASIAKWSKAPVCGTGDHGFESRCSPQFSIASHLCRPSPAASRVRTGRLSPDGHLPPDRQRTARATGACSSMDRALGFGPRGCGFESCQARQRKYHKAGGRQILSRPSAFSEPRTGNYAPSPRRRRALARYRGRADIVTLTEVSAPSRSTVNSTRSPGRVFSTT